MAPGIVCIQKPLDPASAMLKNVGVATLAVGTIEYYSPHPQKGATLTERINNNILWLHMELTSAIQQEYELCKTQSYENVSKNN